MSGPDQCPLFGVERCPLLGVLKCISSIVKSGASEPSTVERLSAFRRVRYWKFYCINLFHLGGSKVLMVLGMSYSTSQWSCTVLLLLLY